MSQVRWCPNCGRMVGISCACGLPFREKALSLQVNRVNFETGEKRNYFDSQGVNDIFGADARERMMEETKGIGYVQRGPDGGLYRRNEEAQRIERLTPKQEGFLFGSDTEG